MHTGIGAQAHSSFPHLIHEMHANCPHCLRELISHPVTQPMHPLAAIVLFGGHDGFPFPFRIDATKVRELLAQGLAVLTPVSHLLGFLPRLALQIGELAIDLLLDALLFLGDALLENRRHVDAQESAERAEQEESATLERASTR